MYTVEIKVYTDPIIIIHHLLRFINKMINPIAWAIKRITVNTKYEVSVIFLTFPISIKDELLVTRYTTKIDQAAQPNVKMVSKTKNTLFRIVIYLSSFHYFHCVHIFRF